MYAISDLHLGHSGIIDLCNRPFTTFDEMNQTLINNWYTAVDPDDEVLFLGDLTLVDDTATIHDWITQLHGNIQFVVGDHDTVIPPAISRSAVHTDYQFTYRDISFYAVHEHQAGSRAGCCTATITITIPTCSRL